MKRISTVIKVLKNIFWILILIVAPTLLIDHFLESLFLENFMAKFSLPMMGTMLAIYMAVLSSFLKTMSDYEKTKNQSIFDKTTSGLKETVVAIFIIFIIHFFLLSGTPEKDTFDTSLLWIFIALMVLMGAKVLTFSLYIRILFELSMALFSIRKKTNAMEYSQELQPKNTDKMESAAEKPPCLK